MCLKCRWGEFYCRYRRNDLHPPGGGDGLTHSEGADNFVDNQHLMAPDGKDFNFCSEGQDWLVTWLPPVRPYPDGKPHGSAAICITPEGQIVLVRSDEGPWEFPGGST